MNRDQMAWEYLLVVTRERAVTFTECFDVADKFLAYAAKEREKEKPKCEHGWVSCAGDCWYCQWCGTPKVNPATTSQEPVKKHGGIDHDCDGYKCQHISHRPNECFHNWCSINGGPTHCLHCGAPKVKDEKKDNPFIIGTRVIVFDRYRLALPCFGEVIKTEGVNNGCLVMLDKGSHGRADERYPEGIYVDYGQLRLPGEKE